MSKLTEIIEEQNKDFWNLRIPFNQGLERAFDRLVEALKVEIRNKKAQKFDNATVALLELDYAYTKIKGDRVDETTEKDWNGKANALGWKDDYCKCVKSQFSERCHVCGKIDPRAYREEKDA